MLDCKVSKPFVLGSKRKPENASFVSRIHWDSFYPAVPTGTVGDPILSGISLNGEQAQGFICALQNAQKMNAASFS